MSDDPWIRGIGTLSVHLETEGRELEELVLYPSSLGESGRELDEDDLCHWKVCFPGWSLVPQNLYVSGTGVSKGEGT